MASGRMPLSGRTEAFGIATRARARGTFRLPVCKAWCGVHDTIERTLAAYELFPVSLTRLWRILMRYVEQAHAKSDWSSVRQIAVDEISACRGCHCVTNVLDDPRLAPRLQKRAR
jgi:hypothetical protein